MNLESASIALDQATVGMTLAAQLLDDSGNVLLPAGAVLSAAMLDKLERRGVATLTVAMQAEADPHAVLADKARAEAERERRQARLAHLFRHSAAEGATGELVELLLNYHRSA
jgi:hypothetical protein